MKPFAFEVRNGTRQVGEGDVFKSVPDWAKETDSLGRPKWEVEPLYAAGQIAKLLPVVDIQTMKLADGRADHFVRITVEDRSVTPHMFRDKYKSEYHVQLYTWLFTGVGEKPYVMDFAEDEWPARTLSPQEQVAELLEEARSEIVVAIAFLGRDQKTPRIDTTIDGLITRLVAIDKKIQEAQRK